MVRPFVVLHVFVLIGLLAGHSVAARAAEIVDETAALSGSVIEGTSFAEEQVAEPAYDTIPCDCDPSWCESLLTSPTLTGDWGGARSTLMESGVIYQGYLTQFYQGVASGGVEQQFKYGGKVDQFFTFQGEKLGLWKGLLIGMHAETRFGQDSNLDAVGLAPVNTNMIWPSLEQTTAITGLTVTQMLSEEWLVSGGKLNMLDLFNSLYPQGGRGIDGFMNASILFPLAAARPLSLSVNGVGITKLHEGQVQGSLSVVDPNNSSTTAGVGNLFESGATILAYWRHFTEFRGLPGAHAILGEYSSKSYTSVDREDFYFIPNVGIVAGKQSGTWAINYLGEQRLWEDACNSKRNIGLTTSWGISDGNPNPIRWSSNVALQGYGLIESRPADTMGIAYFYTGLSGDFKDLVSPVVHLRDLQGTELYYNYSVTPWFNLTPDLQVIRPSDASNDTAVVVGLRAKLTY